MSPKRFGTEEIMALNPGPARAVVEMLLSNCGIPDRTDCEVEHYMEGLLEVGSTCTSSSLDTYRSLNPDKIPAYANELLATVSDRLALSGHSFEITEHVRGEHVATMLWYALPTSENPNENIKSLLTLWDGSGNEIIVPKLRRTRAIWNDEWGPGDG